MFQSTAPALKPLCPMLDKMTFQTIKYYLVGLTFCFGLSTYYGQQNKIDSLQKLLQNAKHDTTRLHLYIELGNVCNTQDYLKYATPAITLAEKLLSMTTDVGARRSLLYQKTDIYNFFSSYYAWKRADKKMEEYSLKKIFVFSEIKDTALILNSYLFLCNDLWLMGNLPKALDYCQKGLSISATMNRKNEMADFLYYMGAMYEGQGDYTQALDKFQQSLKLFSETKDTAGCAGNYILMGSAYSKLHKIDKAIENYRNILSLYPEENRQERIPYVYNYIGDAYRESNDLLNALKYYNESLTYSRNDKTQRSRAIKSVNSIGNIYLAQKNTKKAIEYHYLSLSMINDSKDLRFSGFRSSTFFCLANDYFAQKNYKFAKKYIDSALYIQKMSWGIEDIRNSELLATRIDSANGDGNGSYEHYKQYIIFRDKLINEDVKKAATKEKYQSEYEKQKSMDKTEQDKKDILAKDEMQRQKILRNSFIGGFALMLLLAIVVFRSYRQKQKSNTELAEKNIEIEEKNKDILDSIRYAKRIQTSLLPTDKYIDRILSKKDKSTGA